jgi:hypothetical protein
VAHETLFRVGIVSDLFCGVIEIFLVLALYRLFRQVERRQAALMLAKGTELTSTFDTPRLQALATFLLRLHHQEILAAQIFCGLWLVPLALLVVRCGFLPRFLGVWLIAKGASVPARGQGAPIQMRYVCERCRWQLAHQAAIVPPVGLHPQSPV